MRTLKDEIHDIERFEEILVTLVEQGFSAFLDRLDLMSHVPVAKRVIHRSKKPGPERLRETFEQLGPTFIKFGQLLSQRPDVMPERYITELEKLENDVPSFDLDKARSIVDEEIGLEKFHEFEKEPIAAASIAQVHRATLENGEEVVVKIRRPDIKERIKRDLDILLYLAKKIDKHTSFGDKMAYKDVKEFANWTRQELNFKREIRNAELIRDNLGDEPRIRIPETYPELTTEKVLVMEYVDAVRCNNLEELDEMEVDIHEIAHIGINAHLKQMFRDGLFHADPHPSNFLIDEDGNLVYIDFGMVGRLTKQKRRQMALMILHLYDEDIDAFARTVEKIGYTTGDPDIDSLKEDLEEVALELKGSTLEEQQIVGSMGKIAVKSARYGIYMPNYFMVMGKGMSTMEGIGLQVYPEFDFEESCRDTLEQIIRQQYGPRDMGRTLMLDLMENQDLLTKLPSKINKVLENNGHQTRIHREVNQSQNLVPASLILGSSVMLAFSLSSQYLFYAGLAGLVAAAFFLWRS